MHTVLTDVQASHFFFFAHAKADRVFDGQEDSQADGEGPQESCRDTHRLDTKLSQASRSGKQADRQCAPDAADTVYRDGTNRIVNTQLVE